MTFGMAFDRCILRAGVDPDPGEIGEPVVDDEGTERLRLLVGEIAPADRFVELRLGTARAEVPQEEPR